MTRESIEAQLQHLKYLSPQTRALIADIAKNVAEQKCGAQLDQDEYRLQQLERLVADIDEDITLHDRKYR